LIQLVRFLGEKKIDKTFFLKTQERIVTPESKLRHTGFVNEKGSETETVEPVI
jgi:hypothetical protein